MPLDPDKAALKLATDKTFSALGGQLKAVPHCRVGKSELSQYASRNNDDRFIPIDVVFDLEPLAVGAKGYPHITRQLALRCGFSLVRLPDTEATSADLMRLMGKAAEQAGNIVGSICAALAEGRKPTPAEAGRMIATVDDKIECYVALRASLVAIQKGE